MGNTAKRDAARAERAKKKAEALRLRIAGATHEEIRAALGYRNRSESYRLIEEAIAEITHEPAVQARALELERLDAMVLALWGKAMKGDRQVVETILSIMDRRSKYLGLDAPKTREQANVGEQMNALAAFLGAAFGVTVERKVMDDGAVVPQLPAIPDPPTAFLDAEEADDGVSEDEDDPDSPKYDAQ